MDKIAVIGLGLIGGSLCAALTEAGYSPDGFDNNEESVEYALRLGYIQKKATNLKDYDLVILALPASVTLRYLTQGEFKDGALVTDICGVKSCMEKAVYSKKRNYRYIGMHPMAGKETSGIQSATPNLFKKANLIITLSENTLALDLEKIKGMAKRIGFGKIVECTALEHDKKIALTSQLAHLVSNGYVKSEQVRGCDGFTGGSFQDMTRIAGVDESMWTELYLYNKECIVEELNGLVTHLQEYRDAIENDSKEELSRLLREGRKIRETIKRRNN